MTHVNAFGFADGSRGPLDTQHDFVTLPPRYGNVGRPISEHLRARVVVGGQGAGKTLFLRRMQVHFHEDPSVNSVPTTLETSELDTDTVIRFSQMFSRSTNTEAWTRLWERCLWLAAACLVLEDSEKHGSAGPDNLSVLQSLVVELSPAPELSNPVEIIAMICRSLQGKDAFAQTVNDPLWLRLRSSLQTVLADSREVYLFVDAIDDNFHYAPAYWQQCQRGLFYAVMHLLRNATFDSRLHVVISIRDLVFSSIQRGEHALRYVNDQSIVSLAWDWEASAAFLGAKIANLDLSLFRDNGGTRDLECLLGRKTIAIEARGTVEPMETYLLRHTRLCPRDIIHMGNELAATADRADCLPAELTDEEIRDAVARCAKRFTRYSLIQAGNQILTNIMPWNASSHKFTESFLNEDEYTAESMEREVRSVLLSLASEVFGEKELSSLESEASTRFGNDSRFSDVLWQNGLLGYFEDSLPRFYRGASEDRSALPRDGSYLLHPILLDSLPSVGLANATRYEPGVMGQ